MEKKSEKVLKKMRKLENCNKTNRLKSFWGAVDHECWVAIDSMCATSWAHAPELDSNSTSTRDRPEIVTTASFTGPAPRDSEFLTFLLHLFVVRIFPGRLQTSRKPVFLQCCFSLGQENHCVYYVFRA